MNNTNFSDRLKLCLDKEGFPPKNRGRIQLLAEMVGLTHRGASKWVNGESTPPAKKYTSLAEKLNVSEEWLRTGKGEMLNPHLIEQSNSHEIQTQDVNLYDITTLLTNNRVATGTIKCNLSYKGSFFGIKLDTEAMSPRFPSNSIIIFDNSSVKDGDFVLVDFAGLPCPIFRQYLNIGGTIYLNAHNPKFDRLVLTDKCSIIGKLVQAILCFD